MSRTPTDRIETEALEFQNGTLVKVGGMRPEYMGGQALIQLARDLAADLAAARAEITRLRLRTEDRIHDC